MRFLKFFVLKPYSLKSIRGFSNQGDSQLVYSFSYVRVGSIVNKVKIQQTLLTGLMVPISVALEYQAIAPPGVTYTCLAIGAALNTALYSFGHLFYKLIGKVYLDEKRDIATFAYVGFSGQRLEFKVPRDEVILDENESFSKVFYTKLCFTNSNLSLKLNEKYYDYCNVDLARKVFGESFQRT